VRISRSIRHDLEKLSFAHMVGTGTANQNSARLQHLQCAKVELFVSAEGGFQILLGLCEGGRVDNNGVVLPCGG
jgi:hypothetical protein